MRSWVLSDIVVLILCVGYVLIGSPHLQRLETLAECGWVTNLCPTYYVIEAASSGHLSTSREAIRGITVSKVGRQHISASPSDICRGFSSGRDARCDLRGRSR